MLLHLTSEQCQKVGKKTPVKWMHMKNKIQAIPCQSSISWTHCKPAEDSIWIELMHAKIKMTNGAWAWALAVSTCCRYRECHTIKPPNSQAATIANKINFLKKATNRPCWVLTTTNTHEIERIAWTSETNLLVLTPLLNLESAVQRFADCHLLWLNGQHVFSCESGVPVQLQKAKGH
jgi:hypothetical protein